MSGRRPNYDLTPELIRVSFEGLHRDTLSDICAALAFGNTHDLAEVRAFTHGTAEIVIDHLYENRTACPILLNYITGSTKLLSLAPQLRELEKTNFEQILRQVFDALDQALGTGVRYRLYTIHTFEDSDKDCFRGLISRGMPSAYVDTFDVQKPDDFGRTVEIPFSIAKYEPVDHTHCYKLTLESIKDLPDKEISRYKNELGVGTLIPETLTWEFTEYGLARDLCSNTLTNRGNYVCALSLDLGRANHDFHARVVDILLLRLIDHLLKVTGPDLAGGINAVQGGLLLEKMEETKPLIDITTAVAPRELNTANFQAGKADRLSSSPEILIDALYNKPSPITLTGNFKSIPAGIQGSPWVFAEKDPLCEKVYFFYDKFKSSDMTICLNGPSGVGKGLLARAFHFNSNRRKNGPFISRPLSNLNRDSALSHIVGCEKGTFTDVGETPSDFELADKGSYFIDEVYAALPEIQEILVGVVDDIRSRRGYRRLGAKKTTGNAIAQGKFYKPDVRIIFAGDPSTGRIHEHMFRRMQLSIYLPDWHSLTRESRTVLLRWYIVRTLAKRKLRAGKVGEFFFNLIVNDPAPIFKRTNMDGARILLEAMADLIDETDPKFTLTDLGGVIDSKDLGPDALELVDKPEPFPEGLFLGAGSHFDITLNPFERLVIKIASCQNVSCSGCVELDELESALSALGVVDKGKAFNCHYLLLAAVRHHVRDGDPHDDPLRTAPGSIEQHFKNTRPYVSWFNAATMWNPGQIKIKGTQKNTEFPGGPEFRNHIEESLDVLIRDVERIASAYPPFLGEVFEYMGQVPYWREWND